MPASRIPYSKVGCLSSAPTERPNLPENRKNTLFIDKSEYFLYYIVYMSTSNNPRPRAFPVQRGRLEPGRVAPPPPPDPQDQADPGAGETSPRPRADFSRCRSLEEIVRRLLQAEQDGEALTTSDGTPYTAKIMATQINKALERVRIERRTLALAEHNHASLPRLDEETMDHLLSPLGITSNGGLREAVARVLNVPDDVRTDARYFTALEEATETGRFNPIWALREAAFVTRYPYDTHGRRPIESGGDDTAQQIVLRWREIMLVRERQYLTQLSEWRQHRETVTLPADRLVNPSSQDHFAQYAQVQAPIEAQYKKDTAAIEVSEKAHRRIMQPMGAYDYAIANQIGRLFAGEARVPDYTGTTTLQSDRPADQASRFVRTLIIPIEGRPGTTMTLNLFSQADARGERPHAFQGIILEEVGSFSTLGTTRPDAGQMADLSAAYKHIRRVEATVRQDFGLDLGVSQDLARRFAPER